MSEERIQLAHGEGAFLMRKLLREEILPRVRSPFLHELPDAATLPDLGGQMVCSTDSYVVQPLFFPGGDIGRLAVHGTVNDLAACGGEPLYLTLAMVLEEGLPLRTLRDVLASIRDAATACGVRVVTGDTKVVPRGAADGMFLNTTGIGRLSPTISLGADLIRSGDTVIVTGTVGDHGSAVLSAREDLGIAGVRSDTAPLHELTKRLLDSGLAVRFLRDPTRGGVSATLHEICESTDLSIRIEESAVPVSDAVRGMCELLGLDPLFVANEGKMLAVVAANDAEAALSLLRQHPLGKLAAAIGVIEEVSPPRVLIRGRLGSSRVLDEPVGALLPRIC